MRKKFLTLALAAVMAFSMSITAFAANEGESGSDNANTKVTVTVTNADDATEIKWAKVVQRNDKIALGWEFTEGVSAPTIDNTTYDAAAVAELGKAQAEGSDTANLENGISTSTSAIAALASAFQTYATTDITTDKSFSADAGLYVVVVKKTNYEYNPMLVYVPDKATYTADDNITLKAKGSEIIIQKEAATAASETVYSKEALSYTVKVNYPYFGANEGKTFDIVDTLTNATFGDEDGKNFELSVKIDGKDATLDKQYTFTTKDNVLTVAFNYDATLAGKQVVVTYNATATEFTSTTTTYNVDNTVTLKKVTPNSENDPGTVLSAAKVVSPTTNFSVYKTDVNDTTTALANAEFKLYQFENALESDSIPSELPEGTKVYTATTGTDGLANFYGLDVTKHYYVVETKAPAGYSLDTTVYPVTGAKLKTDEQGNAVTNVKTEKVDNYTLTTTTYLIDGTYDKNDDETNVVPGDITVKDTTLSSLPFTGGIGTTIFTVLGVAIMVVAAALYFATKKKASNK